MDVSLSGLKRAHETKSLDSDKEQVTIQQSGEMEGKQLIVVDSSQEEWTEVKSKKMGKKGKIETYFNP